MKLYLVQETCDPYEPRATRAVCTSLDSAKRLFPNEDILVLKGSDYFHLHTGEKHVPGKYSGIDRFGPDWGIEEVESDEVI